MCQMYVTKPMASMSVIYEIFSAFENSDIAVCKICFTESDGQMESKKAPKKMKAVQTTKFKCDSKLERKTVIVRTY